MALGVETHDDLRHVSWAWWLLLITGLLGVAAGVIVLVQPGISLVTLAVVAGVFLIVDGLFEIPAAIFGGAPNRGLLGIVGAVSLISGVLLIRHPIAGVVAVALLLGLWLLTLGVMRAMTAFDAAEHRGWHALVAALEIIAGIVMVSSPDIGVATLAVVVGISFVVRGLGMCSLAWMLHGAKREVDAAAPHGAAAAH